MTIYDPVAGGAALVVIDVGWVSALAVFTDPAMGAPRLLVVVKEMCYLRPGCRWRGASRAWGWFLGVRAGDICGSGDCLAAACLW